MLTIPSRGSGRGLDKNFQTQSITERSDFIKNKEQRYCGHCKHSGRTPPDRPGRVDAFCGSGNGTPLQYSCLENPMDGGAWWAAVHRVAKNQARLSDFTFTFHFHALEKEMATHASVLAWRIPGTGEPGGPSVYGVAQSQTQLKRLSSSSSSSRQLLASRQKKKKSCWKVGIR